MAGNDDEWRGELHVQEGLLALDCERMNAAVRCFQGRRFRQAQTQLIILPGRKVASYRQGQEKLVRNRISDEIGALRNCGEIPRYFLPIRRIFISDHTGMECGSAEQKRHTAKLESCGAVCTCRSHVGYEPERSGDLILRAGRGRIPVGDQNAAVRRVEYPDKTSGIAAR
jgi:hypothetical protein